ncbi:MAG: hypothetical protein J5632_00580 [Bacteroidales bacterium]|nr:hypothetical protein [Bacteroidales bacterium]
MAEQRIIVRGHRFELWETAPDGRRHRLLRCYCGYGRNGFAASPAFPASGASPALGKGPWCVPQGEPAPALPDPKGQPAPFKCEGDGRTPVGVFPLEFAFGIAPNPGTALPWKDITPSSFWSSERGTYNTWIEISPKVFQVSQTAGHLEQNRPVLTPVSQKTGHLDQSGFPEGKNAGGLEQSKVPDGERLADYPVQYKYAAVIGYNTVEPQFGAGSAIFLHCYGPRKSWFQCRSKRTATAGCISIPEKIMVRVLRVLRPGAVIDIQA